jgi:hypothetical protein
VLEDFRSVVERALGVEVQDDFMDELRGDRSQDQKGHTRAPLKRRIRIIVNILKLVVLLSLVLLELILEVDLLNSMLLLGRDQDWCAFIVQMHIVIRIAIGVVIVLGVARTTRRWCAKRTQIVS